MHVTPQVVFLGSNNQKYTSFQCLNIGPIRSKNTLVTTFSLWMNNATILHFYIKAYDLIAVIIMLIIIKFHCPNYYYYHRLS